MSIAWFIVLLLGIVAIVMGARTQEYKNATFWFLLAFWAFIVLAPFGAKVLALT